jgi:hypothetical protein
LILVDRIFRQQTSSGRAYFLWVNFFDPHRPFIAPEEYLDRYHPKTLPDPIGVSGGLETKPDVQRRPRARALVLDSFDDRPPGPTGSAQVGP